MATLKDVFDLEQAALKDVRALGGEVIEVPVRPGNIPSKYMEDLGEDLAQFMRMFTGRGYDLSRESSITMANTRFVREAGHEAFGLKLFADTSRIIITRVAILEDESILPNYVRHLKSYVQAEEAPKPQVTIDLPDDFSFGAFEPPKEEPPKDEPPGGETPPAG